MPAWLLPALGVAAGALDSFLGQDAAQRANRTNIKLQREQQQWEKMMSDTAIWRRQQDIIRAGGNPALAFTGGQEASTPSVAPARVEPTWKPGGFNLNTAIGAMQAMNIKANTRLINANAEAQETKNLFLWNNEDLRSQILATTRDLKAKDYDLIEQQIKNAVQQFDATALGMEATALANEKARRTMEAVVQAAIQQTRAGKLDLDALENIASMGGIEAQKAQGVVSTALRILKSILMRK